MSTLSLVVLVALGRSWGDPSSFCRVSDPAIEESSGLAANPQREGGFFTHNDSGDSARFFRLSSSGQVEAIYSLKGVKAVDWEDIALARLGRTPWLYIGDVGDNARKREFVLVHRLRAPSGPGREISTVETFTIRYEDKPRDCEAIFVNPKNSDLWLVSKNREGETVAYVVRRPRGTSSYTAKKVGILNVNTGGLGGNQVTGGDASPDGRHVVLRTYSGALEFDVAKTFDDWVKAAPRRVKTANEQQGEAICYGPDGGSIFTSSEGTPFTISRSTVQP